MNRTDNKPWIGVSPTGPLLKVADVAERTCLSHTQIYELIKLEKFPPLIKIGQRASAMPQAWLDAFIEARAQEALGGASNG